MTARRLHDEAGVALVVVVAISATLLGLVAALLTFAVNSQRQARNEQDWQAGLSAAQAGVDDYLFRLNRDP